MIRHIVAYDRRRGIAKHGYQPWYIPTDEQYFSDMTKQQGGVVVMGRKTFEVIGYPLPGRTNIVLTTQRGGYAQGIVVARDMEGVMAEHKDIWIIGGGQVYAATVDQADELHITEIDADFGCDTFYPEIPPNYEVHLTGEWQEQNGFRFRFMKYHKR